MSAYRELAGPREIEAAKVVSEFYVYDPANHCPMCGGMTYVSPRIYRPLRWWMPWRTVPHFTVRHKNGLYDHGCGARWRELLPVTR